MANIRTRLASERLRRKLSQTSVAMKTGIPAQVLSHLETGYMRPRPTSKNAQKLARFYRVPAEELLAPFSAEE